MRRAGLVVGCMFGLCLAATAQAPPGSSWWVAGEFGEGQLKLSSDQVQGNRNSTFAMGFAGGRRLGDRIQVGLHLNGWLLQAFNLNDPTVGESVSNFGGVIDFFPARKSRLFVRGGAGLSMYTNDQPMGANGSGFGWEAGGGYEIPLRLHYGIAPTLEYASGGLGDVRSGSSVVTGRRFSVVEFEVVAVYHFGGRKR